MAARRSRPGPVRRSATRSAVTVTANDTSQFTDPVDGGVIGFTVNPAANDASATLSAPSAVIQAVTVNGQTSDQASRHGQRQHGRRQLHRDGLGRGARRPTSA